MEANNRKSVWSDLNKFDVLAKEHDFIEVTEWTNGEGWDVTINEKILSLSCGQLEAIDYLTKYLDYEIDRE